MAAVVPSVHEPAAALSPQWTGSNFKGFLEEEVSSVHEPAGRPSPGGQATVEKAIEKVWFHLYRSPQAAPLSTMENQQLKGPS